MAPTCEGGQPTSISVRDFHMFEDQHSVEVDYLRQSEVSTQSIDLDSLFTTDMTTSGSFDLSHMRNVSFGKLMEAIPIPTLLIDSSQSILYANRATEKFCAEVDNLVGKHFPSLFPTPEGGLDTAATVNEVFANRRTQTLEGVMRVGSTLRWCRIHLRSIRFRSQRSVMTLIEDLTDEKKQALINAKYHQLVQIFPIGIAEFNLAPPVSLRSTPQSILQALSGAKLQGGNCEFAKIHGHSDIDVMKKALLSSIFPFEDTYLHFYHTWIRGGFPVRSFETEEIDSQGQTRYFENTLVGNLKNDFMFGVWAMKQDITARKESEQALRAARDKLEERVRERTAELLTANQQLIMEIRDRRRAEQELEKLVGQLQEALAKVKTLSGLLPICASCKKIRDDRGYWTQVEVYVHDHTEADFTHSICPDCAAKLYPEYYKPKIAE